MLNRLEELYMLEGVEYGTAKCLNMHCLFYEMAIEIMTKKQLRPTQNFWNSDSQKWGKDLVRVSLIDNEIEEICNRHSPKCPNLSTLLLRGNYLIRLLQIRFSSI